MTTTPNPTLSKAHPAKFTDSILDTVKRFVKADDLVLDPFAGTGRIHSLPAYTVGVEIEPEWASAQRGTLIGDALHLPFKSNTFNAIITSPTYGNRLADHHNAQDGSKRMSYRHVLGRPLHPKNSGQLQWGEHYRTFHMHAWNEAIRVLLPGGCFLLNVSNHIRKGEEIDVVGFHRAYLRSQGLLYEGTISIETPRLRFGANSQARVGTEKILVFYRRRLVSGGPPRYASQSRTTPVSTGPTHLQENTHMSDFSTVIDTPSTEAPEVTDGTDAAGAEVEEAEKKERRPRGWLETDVKSVTDKFVSGEISMKEGELLTPHRIARLVKELDSLDAAPSTGAVAAVLNRWKELGFIVTNDKPYAFVDYTEEAKTEGLAALKQRRAAARKESRAAAKAEAKAADAAPAPDGGAAPADSTTDPSGF